MNQVIQNIRSGKLSVLRVPDPIARPGCVLIANIVSLISAGTEKGVIELAKKSLLGKALERPDHVRRVIEKIRNEGFFNTLQQVREKLDEPMALGYSSAGVVLACGAGVQEFKPGDRAASNGSHAGIVCVPKHLCARMPENVSFEQGAFNVVGAIALQGVRLAKLELGEVAFVIGLGLVGQLTVAILRASGCRVLGTDPDASKCALALKMGAELARPDLSAKNVEALTRGLGADAVLITASTRSNGPVELAGEAVRKKGRVVAVGAVGLELPRRPYYFKEAEFVVSCSYGPGRYDTEYEEHGRDYPAAYVRWSEQRNMQAVLELMSAGKLDVSALISHRFSIEDGEAAYKLIENGREPYLGILLKYPERPVIQRRIELRAAPVGKSGLGVGCLGAGNFARMVLLPALKKTASLRPYMLCSAGGLSCLHSGEKLGFESITTDENEVFKDPGVSAVFIVTRHDQHASQVVKALQSAKHVFVEKPLALNEEELARIESALIATPEPRPILMVGFNRRFSPAALALKAFFTEIKQPLTLTLRMNAGETPPEHWTQDELVGGGRIIGEACHAIDLATFLAGAPPVRVFAESIGGTNRPRISDDQCLITLRHANGSISSIAYCAGGDKAFPKERVEVFGGGRVGVIDDFKRVMTWVGGKQSTLGGWQQDKGHRAELHEFAKVLSTGGAAPISWQDLHAVTLASILAVRSIREGIPFEIA